MLEPIPDKQGRWKEDDREEDPIEHFRHFDAPWTGCSPSVYGLSASKLQTSQPGRKNSTFLVYPPEACMNSAQFRHALTAIGWTYRTLTTRLGIPENHGKLWSAGADSVPEEIAAWLQKLAVAHRNNPAPIAVVQHLQTLSSAARTPKVDAPVHSEDMSWKTSSAVESGR